MSSEPKKEILEGLKEIGEGINSFNEQIFKQLNEIVELVANIEIPDGSGNPPPPPPPDPVPIGNGRHPEGKVVYDPKKLWMEKVNRPLEIEKYDSTDKNLYPSHAGPTKKYRLDDKGNLVIFGTRARTYHLINLSNQEVYCKFSAEEPVNNVSFKLKSNHLEDDEFGGYGIAFHYKEQTVEGKKEPVHGRNSKAIESKLPKELKYNTTYEVVLRAQNTKDKTVIVTAYLKYPEEKDYVKVLQYEDKGDWDTGAPEDLEKPQLDKMPHFWIRNNPHKEKKDGNVIVYELQVSEIPDYS
jgi:hypothetical protein